MITCAAQRLDHTDLLLQPTIIQPRLDRDYATCGTVIEMMMERICLTTAATPSAHPAGADEAFKNDQIPDSSRSIVQRS